MHKCTNVLTRWLVLSLAHWIECIVLFMITMELYRIQKVKMHIKSNNKDIVLCLPTSAVHITFLFELIFVLIKIDWWSSWVSPVRSSVLVVVAFVPTMMHCKQHPFYKTTTIHFHTGYSHTVHLLHHISVIRLARCGIYLMVWNWKGCSRSPDPGKLGREDQIFHLYHWIEAQRCFQSSEHEFEFSASKNTPCVYKLERWISFLRYNHVVLFVFISCIALLLMHYISLSLAPLFAGIKIHQKW